MVSLDVMGAFDAAWWPSILYNLRNLRCPSNLYNLTRSYFSDRVARGTPTHTGSKERFHGDAPRDPPVVQASGMLCTTHY